MARGGDPVIEEQGPGQPTWWRRIRELHFSNPATPGPPPETPPAAPQPPSRRRAVFLIVGILAVVTLLGPAFSGSRQSAATPLTFSSFIHNVQHDRIVSATIGTDGVVTGTLKGGHAYQS